MTNEERRSEENLILLCSMHHDIVDDRKNENDWKVDRLKGIKKNHEDAFREIGATLEKAFRNQFQDNTETTVVQKAKNLTKLINHSTCSNMDKKQIKKALNELESYLEHLQNVPLREREFMLAVVRRAVRLKNRDRASVNVYDLHSAMDLPHNTIRELGEALERYNVGGINEVDEGKHEMVINDPSYYIGWIELAEFCVDEKIDLRQIIVERRFDLLD